MFMVSASYRMVRTITALSGDSVIPAMNE